MRNLLRDVLLVNGINGTSIAVLTLNDVKDVVAITLGVVSIVSTLLIIRNNLRRTSHAKTAKVLAARATRKRGIHQRGVGESEDSNEKGTKGTKETKVLAGRANKKGKKNKWDAGGTRPYRALVLAAAVLLLFSGRSAIPRAQKGGRYSRVGKCNQPGARGGSAGESVRAGVAIAGVEIM